MLNYLTIRQLAQAEKETSFMSHVLETKRTYSRYISHEIRTPLSVAKLGLDLIEEQSSNLPSDSQPLLKNCKEAIVSAVNILNDLIENERIESRLFSLDREFQPFLPLLSGAIKPFVLMAREKRISMSLEVLIDPKFLSPPSDSLYSAVRFGQIHETLPFVERSEPVPNSARPASVLLSDLTPSCVCYLDGQKISQVIRHLVSNALKFTPSEKEIFLRVSFLSPTDPIVVQDLPVHAPDFVRRHLAESRSRTPTPKPKNSPLNFSFSFPMDGNVQKSAQISPEDSSWNNNPENRPSSTEKRASHDSMFQHFPSQDTKELEATTSPSNQASIDSHPLSTLPIVSSPVGVLLVEVVDTGEGVRLEDQQLLFSEHSQDILASPLQAGGGHGIALLNSKRIVDLHGGDLFVRSEGRGKGSTFSFCLPLFVEHSSRYASTLPSRFVPETFLSPSIVGHDLTNAHSPFCRIYRFHLTLSHPPSTSTEPVVPTSASSNLVSSELFSQQLPSGSDILTDRLFFSVNHQNDPSSSSISPLRSFGLSALKLPGFSLHSKSNKPLRDQDLENNSISLPRSFGGDMSSSRETSLSIARDSRATRDLLDKDNSQRSRKPSSGSILSSGLNSRKQSIQSFTKGDLSFRSRASSIRSMERLYIGSPLAPRPGPRSSPTLSLELSPSSAASSPKYRLVNTRILIVEDVDMVRKLTRRTLETRGSGNQCFEARDGLEALDQLREGFSTRNRRLSSFVERSQDSNLTPSTPTITPSPYLHPTKTSHPTDDLEDPHPQPLPTPSPSGLLPDDIDESDPWSEFGLILMDSVMPVMEGPEAVSRMREMGYRGLILGLTGNVLAEDVDHFKAMGADGVLSKPLNYEKMIEMIQGLKTRPSDFLI